MSRAPSHSVTCLGVGDGRPNLDRGQAAFLYRLGAARVLVDCGEPATRALLQDGARADDLDHVFISHLHFDHLGGLFTLLQGLWLAPRRHPLSIHLPDVGIRPVRELMRTACLFDDWTPFPLTFCPLRLGSRIAVHGAVVTPKASSHLRALRPAHGPRNPRLSEAFSFLLETKDRRVAHSADLGGLADLEGLTREPLDLLVCELAHLDLAEVFAHLAGKPIRQVAFVHLSGTQWRRRARIEARAARALCPIRVRIPGDGERIAF